MNSLRSMIRISTGIVWAAALLLIATTSVQAGEKGADWPRWRGTNLNGTALDTDIFKFDQGYGLAIAWKASLGSGYSSVSIADGRAVTMFSDSTFDFVVALDADTGEEQWRFKIDSTYVGHNGSHNGPISTPLIDDSTVYGLGPKGQLFALDVRSGKLVWSKHIINDHEAKIPFYGFSTVPLVVNDVLVVETGGGATTISGFDKKTGELLWATGNDVIRYQSPIVMDIHGQEQLLCAGDKYVYGLDSRTGKKLWDFEHGGQGRSRGGRSINPVVVADNRVFLDNKRTGGVLFEVKKTETGFSPEEVWTTGDIRQSYNTSVVHDGYLYGYSNRFLSCVDAKTGEGAWKSRTPGDGFVILVDSHLVILTKQGTLHVAEPTPEKYTELASLQLFDNLTWTPPSFAHGRIYARSLREIAAVDIAKVDNLTQLEKPKLELLNESGKFAQFIKRLEAAEVSARKQMAAQFIAEQKQFPIIEDKRFAHIVFFGDADDLAMQGDMLNAGQEVALQQIEGTGLFFRSFELEPDARLDYVLRQDFDNFVTDPRNPHKVPSYVLPAAEVSELRMSEWQQPSHLDEPTGARGTIETLEFESKILENKRNLHVYLPAGYSAGDKRYPTVYVNYGRNAKDMGLMPNTLDNLIAAGRIRSVITVFVEAPNSRQEYSRNQRDQYAQMFVQELLPHIDGKYRTVAGPEGRLFMGGDEAAFAAFYAAFKYPGTASMLAGQSSHLFPTIGGDELTALVRDSQKLDIRFYLDYGVYDSRGPGFDWKDLNKNFVKLLTKKGYDLTSKQVNEGFGFASWRNRTDKILETFFAAK